VQRIDLVTPWGKSVGGMYREDTNDIGVLQSCILHDEYNLQTYNLVPGQIVIDIGAHIGAATLAMCSLGLQVISVEPLAENVQILKQNLALNGFESQCTILQKAAASKSNQSLSVFHMSDATEFTRAHRFIGHVVPRTEEMRGRAEIVKTISLHDIMQGISKCALLKIDCEGSEWDVFKDIQEDVLRRIQYIVGEAHVSCGWKDEERNMFKLVEEYFIDLSPEKNSALFSFKNKSWVA